MTRKVLVELDGEQIDIDDLISALNTSEWKIIKDGDRFYLNSILLDDILETDLIVSFATEFLDKLNGAVTVLHTNHFKVGIGNIKIINTDGKTDQIILCGTGLLRSRSRLYGSLLTSSDTDPKTIPTTVETWLTKSLSDENITDVLHYFNEINWYNLYKIYEIIRRDFKQNKLDINNFCSKTTLNTFTNNANRTRHSNKSFEPPKIEMTISQGHFFINDLFRKWMTTK
jgi:hypothetical protein